MLGVVLVPGLLAAGVGALMFVGLNSWTGFGDFSLAVPDIPTFTTPNVAEFGWAIGIGIAAAVLGRGIRWLALLLQPVVERRKVLLTPVAGMAVAGLAIVFGELSDESASQVLFSGQSALPGSSIKRRAGRWARSCCSSSARAWPTVPRSAPSEADRPSPGCTSAPSAASPSPTFRVCR